MTYKLVVRPFKTQPDVVAKTNQDGSISSFLFDPDNTDYQTYLKWLEEGNQPLPAEEQ